MRIVQFVIMTLIASSVFFACKKDKEDSPVVTAGIEGNWVGKYGFDSETPSEFYRFQIKPNGLLEEYGETGLKVGVGTWTLENTIFRGKTKSTLGSDSEYSVLATYDASKNKLIGTWGFGNNTMDGGTWIMDKQ